MEKKPEKMVYEMTKADWLDVEGEDVESGDVWDFPQCELKDILKGDFSSEDIDVYGRFYDDEIGEIRYGEMPSLTKEQATRKFGEGKPMTYWAEQTQKLKVKVRYGIECVCEVDARTTKEAIRKAKALCKKNKSINGLAFLDASIV